MVNKDFFQALDELETEKKIDKETFITTLEAALTSAYKKMYGEAKSAKVKLDPEKSTIKIYSYKTVVLEVEDPDKEISLEEARLIKKSYKLGDQVVKEETTKDFGRIAAQTAKQVVVQKIKEIERNNALGELADKEDEILSAVVKRIDNGTIYVQIAGSTTEGVMLESDQIPGEHLNVGDRIKVYIKKIRDSLKGLQVQVSRSNPGFVRKLFELEIPDVASGDVIIKNISRVPGVRTKVSVMSEDPHVDPVGSCLGLRGQRINTISAEMNGEKIDLILFSEDPLEYIARALSPATVLSVEANESLMACRVIVPDDKLSLAIGKGGQNVRLAAKLTGWKIEIKPESQSGKTEEAQEQTKTEPEAEAEEYELTELAEEPAEPDFDGFEFIDDDDTLNDFDDGK